MSVPKDPVILLSFINLKLRDYYKNLDLLCDDLQIDQTQLKEKLATINYIYDVNSNQFK